MDQTNINKKDNRAYLEQGARCVYCHFAAKKVEQINVTNIRDGFVPLKVTLTNGKDYHLQLNRIHIDLETKLVEGDYIVRDPTREEHQALCNADFIKNLKNYFGNMKALVEYKARQTDYWSKEGVLVQLAAKVKDPLTVDRAPTGQEGEE